MTIVTDLSEITDDEIIEWLMTVDTEQFTKYNHSEYGGTEEYVIRFDDFNSVTIRLSYNFNTDFTPDEETGGTYESMSIYLKGNMFPRFRIGFYDVEVYIKSNCNFEVICKENITNLFLDIAEIIMDKDNVF